MKQPPHHHQKILQGIQSAYETIAEEFSQARTQTKDLQTVLPSIQGHLNKLAITQKQKHKTLHSPAIILDLGCGNGRLAGFLAKELHNDFSQENLSYLGMDSSKKLLAIAQKNNPAQKFLEGDMLKIPLKDNSIDIVCSWRAFHHLPSAELQTKALQEIRRILKPGGLLIITVWNLWQPQFRKHRLESLGRSITSLGKWHRQGLLIPWGKKATRYYYAFKPAELKKLLEQQGYTVTELLGINGNQTTEVKEGSDIMAVANK